MALRLSDLASRGAALEISADQVDHDLAQINQQWDQARQEVATQPSGWTFVEGSSSASLQGDACVSEDEQADSNGSSDCQRWIEGALLQEVGCKPRGGVTCEADESQEVISDSLV
jgi:hypothetical protein